MITWRQFGIRRWKTLSKFQPFQLPKFHRCSESADCLFPDNRLALPNRLGFPAASNLIRANRRRIRVEVNFPHVYFSFETFIGKLTINVRPFGTLISNSVCGGGAFCVILDTPCPAFFSSSVYCVCRSACVACDARGVTRRVRAQARGVKENPFRPGSLSMQSPM